MANSEVENLLRVADRLMANKDYAKALEVYEKAILLEPNNASAWRDKGFALGNLNRNEEALEALDKAVSLNDKDSEAWRGRGVALSALGRQKDALVAIERSLSLNANNSVAWFVKGQVLWIIGRNEEAIGAYDKCISLNEKDKTAWMGKSLALLSVGRIADALQAIEKSTSIDDRFVAGWHIKSMILYRLGRDNEALEAAEKILSMDEKDASAWLGKAESLHRLGLMKECIESIDKALSYVKRNPALLNMKGLCFFRLGIYEDAARYFEEALREKSDHRFIFNRATALAHLKKIGEAEDLLKRAIELAALSKDKKSGECIAEYRRQLELLRKLGKYTMWIDWWFGEGGIYGWAKRIIGVTLFAILVVYLVIPMFAFNTELFKQEGRHLWLNVGQNWELYLVPVAALMLLLLSPMIRSVSSRGLELSPVIDIAETRLSAVLEEMRPKPDFEFRK